MTDQNLAKGTDYSAPIFTGLPFGVALVHLKNGQKVRRAVWKGHWILAEQVLGTTYPATGVAAALGFMMKSMIIAVLYTGECVPAQPYQQDILAEDWEVVDFKFPK